MPSSSYRCSSVTSLREMGSLKSLCGLSLVEMSLTSQVSP